MRTVDKRRLEAAALMLLIALSPSCGPKTPAEDAGVDQEITRNIMWHYHNDLRFAEIRVSCEDREVTIEGRVQDAKSAADAIRIAMANVRGGKVVSKLVVRPR
jgi:osmotically-inducible protein OsmY